MSDNVIQDVPPGTPPPPPPQKANKRGRLIFVLVVVLLLASGAGAFAFFVLPRASHEANAPAKEAETKLPPVELVAGKTDTLRVPEEVRKALGIDRVHKVKALKPDEGKPLVLPGSTALDPNGVRRIRTRFNADVVDIAQVNGRELPSLATKSDRQMKRDIRAGDTVKENAVLATLWSVEVGLRKMDLADAIVQFRLDEQRLRDRTALWKDGSLPRDLLNQTQRDVITDRNNMDRAERNLLVWKVPKAEIAAVRNEAEMQAQAQAKGDMMHELSPEEKEKRFQRWARSALIAPITGTIIESNIGGKGEYLPDNTVNLFTIANVERLQVLAYLSEDLLKELTDMDPKHLNWTIKTAGVEANTNPTPIEDISYILDPNTHTAVVKGFIDNPNRKLRAGQYVSAEVKMPPPQGVVEIPLTALAEDGRQSFVFVQADPKRHEYTMRRVQVVRRFEDTAYIRSALTQEEMDQNQEDEKNGLRPREPLVPKDRILKAGVLELRSALEDLTSKGSNAK